MRRLLYGLSVVAMLGGALGLALLPRITTHWLWFGLLGAAFSAMGGGGWVLGGATAGEWPRPRAGWVLMIGGFVGSLVSLIDWHLFAFLWAGGGGVTGLLLILPLFPSQRQQREDSASSGVHKPGRVHAPPVARRQDGR